MPISTHKLFLGTAEYFTPIPELLTLGALSWYYDWGENEKEITTLLEMITDVLAGTDVHHLKC